ncbi:MAG: group 1 truncated hemoglobin, partial [Polyangia bacterium]
MRTKIAAAFLTLVSCATGVTVDGAKRQAVSPTTSLAGDQAAVVPPSPVAQVAGRPAPVPLFNRLGGKPAIGAVVDEFLSRVAADERINGRFANADLPHLRKMLVEFICEASGGPCKYSGKDMRTAHAGMRLVDLEFDALVEDLKGALDRLKVPGAEQGQLLGALAPLRPQVVEGPSAPPVRGAPATAATSPVLDKAHALRQASSLLEKAEAARVRGSRSYAEQLFSGAELLVAPEALSDLAPLFREGAPPRVTTPLKRVPADSPAQPTTVGSSEEDQPDRERPRRRAVLTGSVVAANGRPLTSFAVVTLE